MLNDTSRPLLGSPSAHTPLLFPQVPSHWPLLLQHRPGRERCGIPVALWGAVVALLGRARSRCPAQSHCWGTGGRAVIERGTIAGPCGGAVRVAAGLGAFVFGMTCAVW